MKNPGKNQNIVKDTGVKLLSEGASIRIKALGYSMYPSIRPGCLILIEPLKVKGLPVPGEIIAIRRENGMIVHRLTKIINEKGVSRYIARGDSNSSADKPVNIDIIVGRIVMAETTGENQVPADISINTKPKYFFNRIKIIGIILWKKIG